MSWQPCTSSITNNTHLLESFPMYLFLESNNRLVPQLNKFEKVGIPVQHYLCIIRNFNKAINRSVFATAINSISVTRVALSKVHLIILYLLEDHFSFFSAFWHHHFHLRSNNQSWVSTSCLSFTYWWYLKAFKVI